MEPQSRALKCSRTEALKTLQNRIRGQRSQCTRHRCTFLDIKQPLSVFLLPNQDLGGWGSFLYPSSCQRPNCQPHLPSGEPSAACQQDSHVLSSSVRVCRSAQLFPIAPGCPSCLLDWVGSRCLSFNRMQSALNAPSSPSVGAGHQACALCPDERPPARCSPPLPTHFGASSLGLLSPLAQCSCSLLAPLPDAPRARRAQSPGGICL